MAKKAMVQFTAAWVPPEQEPEDPNCAVVGVIQVTNGGTPTAQPAHVIVRDYDGDKPSWWPGVSVPGKKAISYGPTFGDDEFYKTDLHQTKIVQDAHFTIVAPDNSKAVYRITKVEPLHD